MEMLFLFSFCFHAGKHHIPLLNRNTPQPKSWSSCKREVHGISKKLNSHRTYLNAVHGCYELYYSSKSCDINYFWSALQASPATCQSRRALCSSSLFTRAQFFPGALTIRKIPAAPVEYKWTAPWTLRLRSSTRAWCYSYTMERGERETGREKCFLAEQTS